MGSSLEVFLFLAALGLALLSAGSLSLWPGLLTAVASLVKEHGLWVLGLQELQHTSSVVVARELQSTDSH